MEVLFLMPQLHHHIEDIPMKKPDCFSIEFKSKVIDDFQLPYFHASKPSEHLVVISGDVIYWTPLRGETKQVFNDS